MLNNVFDNYTSVVVSGGTPNGVPSVKITDNYNRSGICVNYIPYFIKGLGINVKIKDGEF